MQHMFSYILDYSLSLFSLAVLFSKPPEIPNPDYMDLDETVDAKRSQKMLYHMNSDPGLYPYNNNLSGQ